MSHQTNHSSASPPSATEQLLPLLLEQMYLETVKGRIEISMAMLCKRLSVRMSTLQRHLTLLESHALVTTNCDDKGRWTTTLTLQGIYLFETQARAA